MKLFKHSATKTSHKTHSSFSGKFAADPYFDWALLFSVFLIMIMAMSFAGYFVYWRTVSLLEEESKLVVSQHAKFDVKALHDTLSHFDARAGERSSVLRGYNGPGDPSM